MNIFFNFLVSSLLFLVISKEIENNVNNRYNKIVKIRPGLSHNTIEKPALIPVNKGWNSYDNDFEKNHLRARNIETNKKGPTFEDISNGISKSDLPLLDESKRFLYLAGISYCGIESLNAWNCTICENMTKIENIKEVNNGDFNLRAIFVVDQDKKNIVISFRGSMGFSQAFELFGFKQVTYMNDSSLQVQEKFMERTKSILPEILLKLNVLVKEFPSFRLVLIGHSLGGAIAMLSAPLIKHLLNLDYNKLAVFTYGQPKVGNIGFITWFNNLPMLSLRIVNSRDMVTKFPYGRKFAHTRNELLIHYDKTSFCKTEPTDQYECSKKYRSLPWTFFHTNFWGINIGTAGCIPEETIDPEIEENLFDYGFLM